MTPKIIILSGDRGTGNNGDRAITYNAIAELRKLIDGVDIVFSAPRPTRGADIYNTRFVPGLDQALYGNSARPGRLGRLFPRTVHRLARLMFVLASCLTMRWLRVKRPLAASAGPFLRELREAQLLLIAGGGQFASLWPVPVLVYSTAALCARIFGVPVAATGLGAGPFDSFRDRFLVRSALNRCEFVAARSPSAFENLSAIGVSDRKLVLGADDALTLQGSHCEEILSNPVETFNALPERFMVAQFRLAPSSSAGQNEIHKFSVALDKVIETLDLTVVFVPFAVSDYADDQVAHYRIYAKMVNKQRVHLIHSLYHPQTLKALIEEASLALGHGLHFCTFVLSSGVPTVGLYNNDY
ncbi:MAG: polysaccharide pyruvyl transferase family protein, partial [Candidatus Hydrogenedentes bacterium]|nr:polysaccharide pyruvyl transferase family protein [Candidatus Hydrogenedentota bacterium]